MRLIPVLTALLVMVALYLGVLKRDELMAIAHAASPSAAEPGTEAAAQDGGNEADAVRAVGVVAVHSVAQSIDTAVVLRGQIQAARQVEVRSETSAIVISEPLRKGTFVKKDDVLCKLDPGIREATLGEARAALAEARSQVPATAAKVEEAKAMLEEAEINYVAADKLKASGYSSETQLKSARAAVRSAEAAVAAATAGGDGTQAAIESALAAVAAAEREIARLTITSPFDGLLESDSAELGSLMQAGSLCATVIQLDPIKLVGFVPETEVGRVEVGTQAGAQLVSGREVAGLVTFLSRSADTTTRTFQVEISVPNPDLSIRDGQTATIAISAAGALAHKLPQSALTLNNDGQLGVRTVEDGNVVAFMPIKLLRDEVGGVWVAGLPEKTDVIVVGQEYVTAGVRVTPTFREAAQ